MCMQQSWVCERQTMNAVCGRHKKHDITSRFLCTDVDYRRTIEPHTQLIALQVKVETDFNEFQRIVTRSPDNANIYLTHFTVGYDYLLQRTAMDHNPNPHCNTKSYPNPLWSAAICCSLSQPIVVGSNTASLCGLSSHFTR